MSSQRVRGTEGGLVHTTRQGPGPRPDLATSPIHRENSLGSQSGDEAGGRGVTW